MKPHEILIAIFCACVILFFAIVGVSFSGPVDEGWRQDAVTVFDDGILVVYKHQETGAYKHKWYEVEREQE